MYRWLAICFHCISLSQTFLRLFSGTISWGKIKCNFRSTTLERSNFFLAYVYYRCFSCCLLQSLKGSSTITGRRRCCRGEYYEGSMKLIAAFVLVEIFTLLRSQKGKDFALVFSSYVTHLAVYLPRSVVASFQGSVPLVILGAHGVVGWSSSALLFSRSFCKCVDAWVRGRLCGD